MKMSVLVVDDEKHIRGGIIRWLNERPDRFYPVHEAKNIEEALETLKTEKADITVSDIRMPGGDGIQLMQEAQRQGLETEFLLVSGFNEFEYARSALSLGARGYILKPIDRNEFFTSMEQIARGIDTRKKTKDALSEALVKRLLGDAWPKPESVERYFQEAKTNPPSGSIRLIKVAPSGSVLHRITASLLCIDLDNQAIYSLPGETTDDTIKTAAEQAENGIFIGASGRGDAPVDLARLIGECREAASYHRVVFPLPSAAFGALPPKSADPRLPIDRIKTILDRIGALPISETLAEASELLPAPGNASAEYYADCARLIGSMLVNYVEEALPEEAAALTSAFGPIGDFQAFTSLGEYRTQLGNALALLDGHIAALKTETNERRSIDAAARILRERFSDPNLSMYAVAEEVGLSYSYFSHLFRRRTGQSFLDYLRKVRTSRAKELLESGTEKINRIAELCGYSSARMLRAAFEETYGMTPADYRAKGARLTRANRDG